jgi:hypothetical protein
MEREKAENSQWGFLDLKFSGELRGDITVKMENTTKEEGRGSIGFNRLN